MCCVLFKFKIPFTFYTNNVNPIHLEILQSIVFKAQLHCVMGIAVNTNVQLYQTPSDEYLYTLVAVEVILRRESILQCLKMLLLTLSILLLRIIFLDLLNKFSTITLHFLFKKI